MTVSRGHLIPLLLAAGLGLAACSASPESAPETATPAPGALRGPEQPATPAPPSAEPTPDAASADWNPRPASIAALGDSITTGFDACALLDDCPEASWATGTDGAVDSLARRLDTTAAWNEAVTGARMADLPAQAARAVRHGPELLTVLAGANDVCAGDVAAMTSTEEFRRDFTRTLTVIWDALPDSQVYVASVPDLRHLWAEGRESTVAQTVWGFGVCPTMLRDPLAETTDAQARRGAVADRVAEYNTALAEVCDADARCRHDEGAVHGYPFTAAELSAWDWFHPSRQGQRVLAQLAYEGITAAPGTS